jgi:hypothetical protein
MAVVDIGLGSYATVNVVAAATSNIGAAAGLKVKLTGTGGPITSFGASTNKLKFLEFEGATLTHNATSLKLPTEANIVTDPGDTAIATSDASGNWTVSNYQRKSGEPLVGAALDSDLTTIAGLTPSNDDILQRKAGAWTNRTIAQLLTDLGLGSVYQPLDADLTSIAALTTTAYGRSLLETADAAALRTLSGAEQLGVLAGINTQTGSYTLVLTDIGKAVEMNVAGANNLTVPLNSTVAFPVGARIDVTQIGAGQTTIVATGGVTIRQRESKLKLAGQYAGASLYKRATDEWVLFGDLSA